MTAALTAPLLREGASSAGVVGKGHFWPVMTEEARAKALELMPALGGLICGIFPYYTGKEKGNIALYARGQDYHGVLLRRLEAAAASLRAAYPDHRFSAHVDVSPFPEKYAAAAAGLGVLGRHTLLITPAWGSYVFIGVIATTLPIEAGRVPGACSGCGKCVAACPAAALAKGLNRERCLSALTQQRGTLSHPQEKLIRQCGMVWGCDLCQKACPANAQAQLAVLPEFLEDRICSLTPEDTALSDRAFRQKYKNRAFAWRGVAPLRRNMHILGDCAYPMEK